MPRGRPKGSKNKPKVETFPEVLKKDHLEPIQEDQEVSEKIEPINKLENQFETQKKESDFLFEDEEEIKKELNSLLKVEQIDFMNGENCLSLRIYCRTQNNSYRMKIFLNEKMEILPSTFLGKNSAMNFWKLLKGSLKSNG